jgi:hypothetical protein
MTPDPPPNTDEDVSSDVIPLAPQDIMV